MTFPRSTSRRVSWRRGSSLCRRSRRYAGNSYAPASYNPQLGLLYTSAIDNPRNSGRGPKGAISAYNPASGELVWRQTFEGYGQAGSVSTAGGLLFVGAGSNVAGYFYAYDAKTGEPLWKFNTGSGLFSSPSVSC